MERLEYRMAPYLPTLRSFELLDQSVPHSEVWPILESTWDAMESMVDRCNPAFLKLGLPTIEFRTLKKQLKEWRRKAAVMEETTKSGIRKNLLRHFHNSSEQDEQDMAQAQANLKSAEAGAERAQALLDIENFVARIPSEIGKYAICCFTFTPESVIAEDQFSHMNYNQDGAQNCNGNASVFDIIITKEYEVVDKDAMAPMPDKPKWHPGRAALEHNLTWRN